MSSSIKRPVDDSGDTSYDRFALLSKQFSTVDRLSLIQLPLKLVFRKTVETKLSVMISFKNQANKHHVPLMKQLSSNVSYDIQKIDLA